MTWRLRGFALAAVLTLTGAAASPFPLESLLKDAEAARTFNYWSLRENRDGPTIEALFSDTYATLEKRHAGSGQACFSEAQVEIRTGLMGVMTAASPAQWRRNRDAAASAVRHFDVTVEALLKGTPSGDADLDKLILPYVSRATVSRGARDRDLALRTARDQVMRLGTENATLLGPLDASTRTLVSMSLFSRACRTDADNQAWIKHQIRTQGWFNISRYGADADKDAWLLVQHADSDSAFQTEVLALLDGLRVKGETNPRNYAYLYDRVAINTGRPQRYGTQGGCKDGERFTSPLENPAEVDRLRGEVGMTSLAEYQALFRCRKPAG
jgi:hypothetical protein